MSIIKGQMEVETGDVLYPKTSIDMIEGNNQLLVKQLLINNDFQINQRGKTEYNFNKQGGYGLDMWQHRQGSYYQALIVTPIKGGGVHVKLGTGAGAGLRQYLDVDKFKIGQSYTTVIKIDNTEYKGMIILENSFKTIIENDVFVLELGFVEENKIAYSLWFKNGNSEYDIWFADLFEGDIAYHHVKKKYFDDLMECQQYYFTTCDGVMCNVVNNVYVLGFTFPVKMKSRPLYEVIRFETGGGTDKRQLIKGISLNNKGVLFITLDSSSPKEAFYQYYIAFSCEPL